MRYITPLTSTADLNAYMNNYVNDYFEYQMNNIFNSENNQFINNIALFDENMINDSDNKFYYNLNRHQSKFSAIKLGDICYLDRNNEIYITDEILEKNEGYIPIAVCFIPSDFFFPSSPARFVSCYGYCSAIDIVTTNSSYFQNDYTEFKYTLNTTIGIPKIYVSSNKKINTDIDSAIEFDNNNYNVFMKPPKGTFWNTNPGGTITPNQLVSKTSYLCSLNEEITYTQEVQDADNLYIIPGYDYEDIMSVSDNKGLKWFNNNTIIYDDSFGYEHMYYAYLNSDINSSTYYRWRNNIIGAKELDNKVFWYIPAICELVFLRMHLGTIKDICYNIQKEYNFYYYDMFNINTDIISSTCLDVSINSYTGAYFYIDKYGILKNTLQNTLYSSDLTYPVFQL